VVRQVQPPDDVIVQPHDQAEDVVGLVYICEGRASFAPDHRHPFARRDEIGADENARQIAIEFAQQHDVVIILLAKVKVETVEIGVSQRTHANSPRGGSG